MIIIVKMYWYMKNPLEPNKKKTNHIRFTFFLFILHLALEMEYKQTRVLILMYYWLLVSIPRFNKWPIHHVKQLSDYYYWMCIIKSFFSWFPPLSVYVYFLASCDADLIRLELLRYSMCIYRNHFLIFDLANPS